MTQAHELERQIRDLINTPRRKELLLKDRAVWAKLCSSLDVLGDTELALESYLARKAGPRDTGELYLLMYGVLQVLYVQQDAVKHLAEALSIPYTRSAALTGVRNTRNDATGHPTSRYGRAFNFISRMTMFKGGFEMLTLGADGSDEMKQVDVAGLVAKQRREIGEALQQILSKIKEDETTHRTEFRGTKLRGFFPSTRSHTHEKIGEAIDGAGMRAFGARMLESVEGQVENFRAELGKRGLLGEDSIANYFIRELQRPFARLRDYFTRADSGMTAEDAHVFHFFIQEKVNQLDSLAAEIDAEYDKDA